MNASAAAAGENLVWAVDEEHLHNYLLPRDCPRVTFSAAMDAPHSALLTGISARAVVAVEAAWLGRIRQATLSVYRLPPESFTLRDAVAGYYVSTEPVVPLGMTPVEDPILALCDRNVEIRFVPSLWPLREAVIESGLRFSIIRFRNAQPAPVGFESRFPTNR